MRRLHARTIIILSIMLLVECSCNNSTDKAKENNATQTANNLADKTDSAIATHDANNSGGDRAANPDTSPSQQQNNNVDSMLSQMKGLSSMFGKGDSGILKNLGGGGNMDSMMKKMQSMMGGKNGSPGDAIGKSLLNFQLGQMSDKNPLKEVAKGMQQAQENGTAGPAKTYSATYAEELSSNYTIPISGEGNTIVLQYTGGSVANGKKDGLWKNIYVSINTANKWNVFTEAYAEQSAINLKAHVTALASNNENYSVITNDQYKKYNKQPRSDMGKNESDVKVQKIGSEKMFGYNCMHVKITYTITGLGQVAHEQDDIWYSGEVPGAQFVSPVIFENHSPAVIKKIKDAGCSGVLVKSITTSTNSSQLIQLSKIIKQDMPDSTFILPANYQEDKNTALYGIQ